MEETERLSDNNPVGLTRSEVAEKLAPVIGLHNIDVQDDCLKFPGISPTVGIPESRMPEMGAPVILPFKDIASITPFNAHIEVLLYSGELYTFSVTDTVRTHINTYKSNKTVNSTMPTTAKNIARNIWESLDETLSSGKK